MAVAVEHMHCLPNQVIYGMGYVMQSYQEIEEIVAFLEIRADQRREDEKERRHQ